MLKFIKHLANILKLLNTYTTLFLFRIYITSFNLFLIRFAYAI